MRSSNVRRLKYIFQIEMRWRRMFNPCEMPPDLFGQCIRAIRNIARFREASPSELALSFCRSR